MTALLSNTSLLLECGAHIAYCIGIAAAVTALLIYRDMYKTTLDDLKALRNRVYARANDPEVSAETSKEIGSIYRDISDLIRSL